MPSTFDLSTLFVADKAARNQAAESLASQSKNESISWFEEIGLTAALVKVSSRAGGGVVCGGERLADVRVVFVFVHRRPLATRRSPRLVRVLPRPSPPCVRMARLKSSSVTSSPRSLVPSSPLSWRRLLTRPLRSLPLRWRLPRRLSSR